MDDGLLELARQVPADVGICRALRGTQRSIDNYIIPDGGFLHYTQGFLRNLKAGRRPVGQPNNKLAIS